MKSFKHLTIFLVVSTILLFVFLIYHYFDSKPEIINEKRDYPEIVEDGVLVVSMNTNSIDYFIYHGQPMGFQLEMLEAFAADHNLILEIIIENNIEQGIDILRLRDCDILAQSVINTPERDLIVDFTIPVRQTKQVLVQRKPENYLSLSNAETNELVIRDLSQLSSTRIFAQKSTISLGSMQSLANDIIRNFYIVEIDSLSSEQIVRNVSIGIFDYAVCDYNIAKISQSYYPNIDIETEMSLPQSISWAVRPESKILLDSLNIWLENFTNTDKYKRLQLKYINNNRILVDIHSEFYSGNEGKISVFDDLLKKHSEIIQWDWRLLASLIYEESRFNPEAQSWAGAFGLMQLMPFIYNKFVSAEYSGIESQINAGVNYISFLYSSLPEHATDSTNNIKFVLAAYNIGFGHIQDAMNLAQKHGKDNTSWTDVSYYLINLSNPKYYRDSVVKLGYFPGVYAVDFANSIVNRYKHYTNVIPE